MMLARPFAAPSTSMAVPARKSRRFSFMSANPKPAGQ
jgi:hypothetical protein